MKSFLFNSKIVEGDNLEVFSQEQVKNETMFFGSDVFFCLKHGGPITTDFINKLPKDWCNDPSLIIDTRVHMLMPGFFPCIPGFHHDDVPREREDGQPNYINPSYKSKHCLALINGEIAPTEFALGCGSFPDVELGEKYYKIWHPLVEDLITVGFLNKYVAPSSKLIFFDWQTWHQGVPAVANGWRWFGRASINTNRKHNNEIRRQVQVYMENPVDGW